MEQLIEKVRRIIESPRQSWEEIKDEPTTESTISRDYLVYLVAVPIIAHLIGKVFVGYPGLPDAHRGNIFVGLIWGAIAYVVLFAVIYISAFLVTSLAPTFAARKDLTISFKLVAYSYTPALASGIFFLIPTLWPISLVGFCYSIYLYYMGLQLLMETPQDKLFSFAVVSVISLVLLVIIPIGIVNMIF
jgi:hypothetical protein